LVPADKRCSSDCANAPHATLNIRLIDVFFPFQEK
jgi:hypothetical protein